jgi:hypothetical protein
MQTYAKKTTRALDLVGDGSLCADPVIRPRIATVTIGQRTATGRTNRS